MSSDNDDDNEKPQSSLATIKSKLTGGGGAAKKNAAKDKAVATFRGELSQIIPDVREDRENREKKAKWIIYYSCYINPKIF